MKVWYIFILICGIFQLSAQESLAQQWLEKGRQAVAQREFDTAIRCFTSAYQTDPQLETALYNRAVVYIEQNKYEKALSDLNIFLASNPADAEAFTVRAQVQMNLERYEECILDLNKAVELMPTSANKLLRAAAHMATENYFEADADYRSVLQKEPQAVEANVGLGDVYFQKGDYLGARSFYHEAHLLAPEEKQISLKYGLALARLGNYTDALNIMTDSVAVIAPDLAYAARSFCQFRLGDIDAARNNAHIAKAANISSPDAWHMLGIIAAHDGNLEEAVALFDEVIAIDPNHAQAWYNAGKTLYESKVFDRAYTYLAQASEYPEVKGSAFMAIANLKMTIGEEAEACKYFRMACQAQYEAHPEEDASIFCR